MRLALPIVIALLAAGCGGLEYRDTNRAVDANPLCIDQPDRPGEPVSAACERKTEAVWSSESGDSESIDFSGDGDEP